MPNEPLQTAIRIRPHIPNQPPHEQCLTVEQNSILLKNSNHRLKKFEFPSIFPTSAQQQHIFMESCFSLVDDFMNGYNCSLYCYGEKKSGKSYTLFGKQSEESKGVVQRIISQMETKMKIDRMREGDIKYIIRASYIEVNNESIIDLLSIRKNITYQMIENQKTQEVTIKNLQIKSITKLEELQSLLIMGNRKKHYAYSKNLRKSQQSSSIFSIYFQSISSNNSIVKKSRFDIVDMQAVEGQRAKIMSSIVMLGADKQLSKYSICKNALKNIIYSLVYGGQKTQIPYNDSKVTKFLRHSIGGNCKTSIIWHIIPHSHHYESTLSILRLASSSSTVQNFPSNYVDENRLVIKHKLREIQLYEQNYHETKQSYDEALREVQNWKSADLDVNQQMQQIIDENEFVSKQSLIVKKQKQLNSKLEQLHSKTTLYKHKIQELYSAFISPFKQTSAQSFQIVAEQYQTQLNSLKKKDQNLNNLYLTQSLEPQPEEQSQNLSFKYKKLREKQRLQRQQINDLQHQFQSQKELLLNSLRQLEQKEHFYESIAKKSLKKQEINLIRSNSRYDPTKRSYDLPLFMIKNKKIADSERYLSPHLSPNLQSFYRSINKSNSERKFIMNSKISSRVYSPKSKEDSEASRKSISSAYRKPSIKSPKIRKIQMKPKQSVEYTEYDDYGLNKVTRPKVKISTPTMNSIKRFKFK